MKGKGRFGNVKKHTHPDGTVLDSKRELLRYCDLLLLQRAGHISGLKVHERFPIVIAGIEIKTRSARYPGGRVLTYVADFTYKEKVTGENIIEDVKMASGHRTDVYRIKKALMEAMGYKILETT